MGTTPSQPRCTGVTGDSTPNRRPRLSKNVPLFWVEGSNSKARSAQFTRTKNRIGNVIRATRPLSPSSGPFCGHSTLLKPGNAGCSQLFATNSKGKALELFVDSPKYPNRRFDQVAYLDTSAAWDNGTLVLNVVNRHQTESLPADLEVEDKQFGGLVEISEVNGPDIKSQNDFGVTTVKTVKRSTKAEGANSPISFRRIPIPC